MHFTVLVVGTHCGWEEVDELLFPYWFYPAVISEEEMRADPRFVFDVVNLEEAFDEEELRNPKHKEKYENAEHWAKEHPLLSYEKDLGWGYWCTPQGKGGKWDWYLIGGRWTGFFILKQGAEGFVGTPGLFTQNPIDLRAADQARMWDIDWEAMHRRPMQMLDPLWEEAVEIIECERFNSYGIFPDDTKQSYLERHEKKDYLTGAGLMDITAAVLMDGEWYEMKYSGDPIEQENNRQEWSQELKKLLDKIPDDAVLTLVDCHI